MIDREAKAERRRALPSQRRPAPPSWRLHLASLTKITPARLTLGVFSLMIALFTALLSLPAATTSGQRTDLVDALFTAVSAICVTGLVTVETATHWSTFGLTVLMIAMKMGGLGLLTLASLLSMSVMHRLGLAQRMMTANETKAERLAEVGGVLRIILITSTAFEAATFVALTPYMFFTEHGIGESIFLGLFYAISAFNNAGFVPEAQGVEQYLGDPFFSIPIALAVFVGSLGFPVILVVVKKLRTPRRWSLHAKLTLTTTGLLLVLAWFGYLVLEWTNAATLGGQPVHTKLLAAGFAAVMPRSGGFATLDVGLLTPETRLLTDVLMFIGGGSGSTSGGIRVTTFALLMLSIWAEIRGNPDVEVFGRRIPHETIRQAIGVLVMSATVVLLAVFLLLRMTSFSLDQLMFEVLSAFGTVGLSTGITAHLPTEGKWVIAACMYSGRLGPMTLGAALALRHRTRMIQLPRERPIVG
ncbi:MAG: TrkH family potassium uptake protein [Brachybacterium tyrofermentans]|uniref:TrkH family potassium uptake protein n=1 Tax=Brachybacterium tyrofermentans TaxID=47848 RepID=A0ABW0FD11_9MICO|nr:potassium transporter TrkG [Brachybacterium tyrofermentans]SLN00354.1 Potassium uptake protein TrkH [Corynebacterium xerosis]